MASMLRSGKFVRFFSNVTRNFDFNNGGRPNADTQLCSRKKEWEIKIYRSLSTVQLPRKNLNDEKNVAVAAPAEQTSIDRALARAELDVKKLGRVTRDDIEAIAEEIKTLKFATTTQSLLLIRCCGSLVPEEPPAARTKLAKDIWKMLENFGVPLDISHYNALLRVYLENEHHFNPLKFLAMLEEKNIEPNRVTYQRVLASYCLKGDIDGASQVLEMMKAKDMPIGEFVFNSLVAGHCHAGDLESAKGVIKVMTQAGLEPNNETYKALLCGYAKLGQLHDISATISDCEKNEIALHDRDLLEVLYTAAVNNHPSVVDELLTRMHKISGYNQDCINVILRLVNHGQEDEAFKVLLTMKPPMLTDGQIPSVGGFFIRQVVKAKCKPEKIVKYCQKLVESGMNPRAFFRALEAANAFGNKDLAKIVLHEITKQKEMLRPTAFWPLLNAQSKALGERGVLDVLRQMAIVRVIPNVDTINQHVLPHIAGENARSLVRKLRSADVPSGVVALSLLTQSLDRLDFKSAIEVAKIYNISDSSYIRRSAANAYVKSRDAHSLVVLIQSLLRETAAKGTEAELKDRAAEIAGPIVQEIYTLSPKPKLETLEPFLRALLENGIGVPQVVTHFIQEKAGENMTEPVAELLVSLGSGNLVPVDLKPAEDIKDEPTRKPVARFVSLARAHKLEEALKEKEVLEAAKIPFTDGLNILLMDLYAYHEKLDEAVAVFNKLFEQNQDLAIMPPKVLNLSAKLLKAERIEDALKVLGKLKPVSDDNGQASNATEISAWRLLNVAALKGDVDLTNKLFTIIEESKVTKVSAQLLSPLVQVHLVRDDIESALKTFAECAEKHRATPMKSTLASKFIEAEDAQRLQQLMDISIKVHGEMNSLYDLVFAFLSCGRVRQARKVLETPGLRARSQRIEVACQRYVEEKRISELENLVKITQDVFDVDRHMLYDHLLTAYINTNDPKKAVGLWTQMQEEDLLPKDGFLRKLAKFLNESNEPVPFSVPNLTESVTTQVGTQSAQGAQSGRRRREPVMKSESQQQVKLTETPKVIPEKLQKLREALTAEDVDAALDAKQQWETEGGALTVSDRSRFIEVSVRKGRLNDATKLALDMLNQKKNPYPRVLRYLLGALSANGDHEAIRTIGKHLSQETQRNVSFENFLSSSMGHNPAAASDYIDNFLKEIQAASSESNQATKEQILKSLTSKFPRGGLLGILEKNPDLVPKCQELAAAFLKEGMVAPTNTMWCYYMNSGLQSEAKSAWESLKLSPVTIMFQPICRRSKMQGDPALVQSLIEMLSTSPNVKSSALGVAYSAWIDVHCAKNELESALAVVERALKGGLQLTDINHTALVALKSAVEAVGRSFPYSIPESPGKSSMQPDSLADH